MLISTKEQHIEFIQKNILDTIKKALDDNQVLFGLMLMGQAIEILGAYLDNKPLRAKQQSSKRFELAIYKLFPDKYKKVNNKNFLYYQLRTCLIHMFIPTDKISLNKGYETKTSFHLSFEKDTLIVYAGNFYEDMQIATYKLIRLINSGKIKLKKLSAGEINE
jgi:hypothetical protein